MAFFVSACGDAEVSVNLTPNGLGDAITDVTAQDGTVRKWFVKPHEVKMPMKRFAELLMSGDNGGALTDVPACVALCGVISGDVVSCMQWCPICRTKMTRCGVSCRSCKTTCRL